MHIFSCIESRLKNMTKTHIFGKKHDHKLTINGLCIEQLYYNWLQQLLVQFKEFGQKKKDLNQGLVLGLFAEIKFCS